MHAHRLATLLGALALVASLNACATAPAGARTPARHLHIVNATPDSMTALAFAPVSDPDFHEVDIGAPLQGGQTSTDVGVPAGDCLRDVRITFRGGRDMVYPGLDVCRATGLRLTRSTGASAQTMVLVERP